MSSKWCWQLFAAALRATIKKLEESNYDPDRKQARVIIDYIRSETAKMKLKYG